MTAGTLALGDSLERSRLLHREGRLTMVLRALDDRLAELHHHGKRPPEPLLAARRSFSEELAAVRARLAVVA
jgi:hypothetical protein